MAQTNYSGMNLLRMSLCILWWLPVAATAQPFLSTYLKKSKFLTSNFVDTIPLTIRNDRLFIPIYINDSEYLFMLDTGDGLGEIYSNGIIQPSQTLCKKKCVDFNGAISLEPIVTMPDFRLGRLLVRNYPVRLSSHTASHGQDGLLGFGLFDKGIIAKIDTKNKHLIISDQRRLFESEGGYALKYKLHHYSPQVSIKPFQDCPEATVFDTGNPQLFVMNTDHLASIAASNEEVRRQVEGHTYGSSFISINGLEPESDVYYARLNELSWDSFHFSNVRIRTKNGDSNIGASLLRYGSIIINPFRRKLIFIPNTPTGNVEVNLPYYDEFCCTNSPDGKAQVGLIRPESIYHRLGIRKGDIILKVNGMTIISPAFFHNLFRQQPGNYTFHLLSPIRGAYEVNFTLP